MTNTDRAFHKLGRQQKLIFSTLKCASVATVMVSRMAATDRLSIAGQIHTLESVQSVKVAESPHNDGIHRADGGCSIFKPGESAPVECFVMRISDDQKRAIQNVLQSAELYGYGSMIAILKTAWAKKLVAQGFSKSDAFEAADTSGYSFAMHDDIVQRGEWDETGKSYSA